jgi:hypothetical protein
MHLARRESRHPFELYLLLALAVSGLPTAFGEPTAGSIEAALPEWAILMWGFALCVGSAVALVGIALLVRRPATGLLMEQLGLAWVACATLFYSVVIVFEAGMPGLTAALFILGFGLACVVRCVQIQRSINRAVKAATQA